MQIYDANMLKVMDLESSFQNPYDLETIPSELSDVITDKVATDDVCKSLKHFLDDAYAKKKE